MDLKGLPTRPLMPNMKVVGQTVVKISPTKYWPWSIRSRSLTINELEGLANVSACAKYEGLLDLKGLPTCAPVLNMKVVGQTVLKIPPTKDWPWQIKSRSLKLMNLKGLLTCLPVSNMKAVGQTVLQISPTKDWPICSRSPKINTVLVIGIRGQCAEYNFTQILCK